MTGFTANTIVSALKDYEKCIKRGDYKEAESNIRVINISLMGDLEFEKIDYLVNYAHDVGKADNDNGVRKSYEEVYEVLTAKCIEVGFATDILEKHSRAIIKGYELEFEN